MREAILFLTSAMVITSALVGCPPPVIDDPVEVDYRAEMRKFVSSISSYSRSADPSFIVVPQNGEALLTSDGTPQGAPAISYINSISGQACEGLFYGCIGEDCATPSELRSPMMAMLDWAETRGIQAIVADYCTTQSRIDTSYAWNADRSYVSTATTYARNYVPSYPRTPHGVNSRNVTSLADAANMLYLLDSSALGDAASYVWTLGITNFDLLVIDAFHRGEMLTQAQVDSLKLKANGGSRLVLACICIGEAQDTRDYWRSAWRPGSPAWLGSENPNLPGNYVVDYSAPQWQANIYGSQSAYVDRILAAGFDGVVLLGIDAYGYFD